MWTGSFLCCVAAGLFTSTALSGPALAGWLLSAAAGTAGIWFVLLQATASLEKRQVRFAREEEVGMQEEGTSTSPPPPRPLSPLAIGQGSQADAFHCRRRNTRRENGQTSTRRGWGARGPVSRSRRRSPSHGGRDEGGQGAEGRRDSDALRLCGDNCHALADGLASRTARMLADGLVSRTARMLADGLVSRTARRLTDGLVRPREPQTQGVSMLRCPGRICGLRHTREGAAHEMNPSWAARGAAAYARTSCKRYLGAREEQGADSLHRRWRRRRPKSQREHVRAGGGLLMGEGLTDQYGGRTR